MAQVAERAGVSRTLVSFILDGKPGASDETRQRVLAVAEELGYRPDSAARVLAQGRSRTLGVLMDVQQLHQAAMVTSIYPAAEKRGYEVLLSANLPDKPEAHSIDALLAHRCGALILLGPGSSSEYLSDLSQRAPTVVVGERLPERASEIPLATVRTDDVTGMRMAVDYLVELGHRDITHVDGGGDPGSDDRRDAYRQAMRDNDLADHITEVPGAHNEAAGADAGRAIMAGAALPTAILAGNDRCAFGLLDVLSRGGLDVPGDISLMGYDDSLLSDNPRIDLTTIHQDPHELACRAVDFAVDLLEETARDSYDIVLEPSLKVRGTTGAPRPV
ncbi:LacI family DNA-binding transcriptional regulator [Gordonia sp. CPCC 205515]|uniref:LacI family DNA-binding transcriptional regulator n=1 Tax=Gordonia sp. CPCC 205515 TaxID=3140791 RepID=UPI003AF3D3B5